MISLFGIDLKRFLRVFVSLYGRSLNLKTMGCHELIILIRSSGNALCFRCWEYSAAPLTLSPVFHLTQIKFSDAKTKTSCSSTSFLLFFMRDFQTKAILVLLFFKFNNAKTKTPSSSTYFALSLLAYLSFPIQCNPFLLLVDFAFFIETKEYTALCCLSLLPPFYYHRFCIFPTRLPTGSVCQLYGLFRGFTKISTLLRIPMPDYRIVQRFCRGVATIRLAQQKSDI